ncbi:ATPase, T2SS/T4P/T4SS family [Rhizobium leguminosarum]|uniref:Pilus assembly protein n=2 Tax=Rhizobium TaxID=379 RepID=A0A179BW79_RHILE|nr:ATPase, T2SS/T4P/T4SS family [Rhizobium leguminosarum]MBY5435526.1 Flp pilus assembly complex ATPase component TadA [Rhizobium leguminosarum]NEI34465.1 pilus assembly protein [Rhizobium leguminosarum]NEI40828.1 pilus assembly protein [Rhizobium leguminosarum]OAP95441.1 pilus assembly protein [Rhizobium leguminosarum]
MLLKISYEDGSGREVIPLSANETYFVGESSTLTLPAGAGVVRLRGSHVSSPQFVLRKSGQGWSVQHHGRNPTRVDDQPLRAGTPVAVSAGMSIWVPNVTIELVEPAAAPVAVTQFPDQERVLALQMEIHERLLKDTQYDRLVKSSDFGREETRTRIRERLDMFIKEALDSAPQDLVILVIKNAVYRWLAKRIARTGRRDASSNAASLSREEQDNRRLFDVGKALISALQLKLNFESTRSDFAQLDTRFSAAFQSRQALFNAGDRYEIAHMHLRSNIEELMYRWGTISELMDLDVISEIMVTRYDEIYVEKFGLLERYPFAFANERQLMKVIERIAVDSNRSINESEAMADFRMPDGSRVNAVIPPLAVKGACLTIRKFGGKSRLDISKLVTAGALSEPMRAFLEAAVRSRKNIVVSGGTGSGKTTLLNSLSQFIPVGERVVAVEDTSELQLDGIHVVYLQSRPKTAESETSVTIRDLVRNALRMRPDRIIVGECRGAEAIDMLQAMNTGHAGSMTTAHANTPQDMMTRLEVMVLQGQSSLPVMAIRQQIVAAVELVVQLNRLANGRRAVTEISEVIGIDPDTGLIIVEPIFNLVGRAGGEAVHAFTGYLPSFVAELVEFNDDGEIEKLDMFV